MSRRKELSSPRPENVYLSIASNIGKYLPGVFSIYMGFCIIHDGMNNQMGNNHSANLRGSMPNDGGHLANSSEILSIEHIFAFFYIWHGLETIDKKAGYPVNRALFSMSEEYYAGKSADVGHGLIDFAIGAKSFLKFMHNSNEEDLVMAIGCAIFGAYHLKDHAYFGYRKCLGGNDENQEAIQMPNEEVKLLGNLNIKDASDSTEV